MALILHRVDLAPDGNQLTLHLQLSADAAIEARRMSYEWVGKGFRLSPEDDLLETIQALATQDGLRPNAYVNELLVHTMHAVQGDKGQAYPIAITGTLLRPRKPSPWTKVRTKVRLLFSRQTQKL